MYENIDLIQRGEKYYLLVKVNDGLVLEKEISVRALESLISKYRQTKG